MQLVNLPSSRLRSKSLQFLLAATFLLLDISTSSNSQTKWFKFEDNPVLDVGPMGSWEGNSVWANRIILRGSTYQMWYAGFSGTKYWRMGYATSPDGTTWSKHISNPVLDVGPHSWDAIRTTHGYVARVGSEYYMWYVGRDSLKYVRLGFATSPDGITWTKWHRGKPILDVGAPGMWNDHGVARPSVLGPDSAGHYYMWFGGHRSDEGVIKIGFASGTNATTWKKFDDPVLDWGVSGSWDGNSVFWPRVLQRDGMYQMWYVGMTTPRTRRIGYATSQDGLYWIKSAENPVLIPGPEGSWDENVVLNGDVMFDGNLYHMWYNGLDATDVGRVGYAVSVESLSVDISPANAQVNSPVTVRVQTKKSESFSFEALIKSSQNILLDHIELFDDGLHQDGMAGDGLYLNTWIPRREDSYSIDLRLRVQSRNNLTFKMDNAATFTTIGPVRLENLEFIGASTINAGDTIAVGFALRNHGGTEAATSVVASLSGPESLVRFLGPSILSFGDISPGEVSRPSQFLRFFIHEDCPHNQEIRINISISMNGSSHWQDSFTFIVMPPWWASTTAYAFYVLCLVGSIAGAVRYAEMKSVKRKIRQLEQVAAVERERSRISEDMHDEVGATLTEIAILSELAKRRPRESKKHVQQISELSAEVIDSIGQIVWALNPKNDTLDNFLSYVRRYAMKYLGLARMRCHFDMPDLIPSANLSTEVRRNLFLVVKEALHNIVKHSKATEALISVACDEGRLKLSIVDNGRGFTMSKRTRTGNGLENMKKRIAAIAGKYSIESDSKKGTHISMEVTLKGIT